MAAATADAIPSLTKKVRDKMRDQLDTTVENAIMELINKFKPETVEGAPPFQFGDSIEYLIEGVCDGTLDLPMFEKTFNTMTTSVTSVAMNDTACTELIKGEAFEMGWTFNAAIQHKLQHFLSSFPRINIGYSYHNKEKRLLETHITPVTPQAADNILFTKTVNFIDQIRKSEEKCHTLCLITPDSQLAVKIAELINEFNKSEEGQTLFIRLHIIMYGNAITQINRPLLKIANKMDSSSTFEVQGVLNSYGKIYTMYALYSKQKVNPPANTTLVTANNLNIYFENGQEDNILLIEITTGPKKGVYVSTPLHPRNKETYFDFGLMPLQRSRSNWTFKDAETVVTTYNKTAHAHEGAFVKSIKTDFAVCAIRHLAYKPYYSNIRSNIIQAIYKPEDEIDKETSNVLKFMKYSSNRKSRILGTVLCDADTIQILDKTPELASRTEDQRIAIQTQRRDRPSGSKSGAKKSLFSSCFVDFCAE